MAAERTFDGSGGRERLLAVALELFLDAGYEGVSMQQIADAAAMTKGAPYHHFSSKEELFGLALGRHFDRIHAGLADDVGSAGDLRERMIRSFSYLVEHSDAGMVRLVADLRRLVGVERMAGFGVSLDRLRACNRSLFEQAAADGVPLTCSPDEAAEVFLSVQIGQLSLMEFESGLAIDREAIGPRAVWVVDAMLRGLLAVECPGSAPERSVSKTALADGERC